MGIKTALTVLAPILVLVGCADPSAEACEDRSSLGLRAWMPQQCGRVLAQEARIAEESRQAREASEAQQRASQQAAAAEAASLAAARRRATQASSPDRNLLTQYEARVSENYRKVRTARFAHICGVRPASWVDQISLTIVMQQEYFYNELRSRAVNANEFVEYAAAIWKKYEGTENPVIPSGGDCRTWFNGDNGLYELDQFRARAMGRGY